MKVKVIKKSERTTNKNYEQQYLSEVYVYLDPKSDFKRCLFRIENEEILLPVDGNMGLIVTQFVPRGEQALPEREPLIISGNLRVTKKDFRTQATFHVKTCFKITVLEHLEKQVISFLEENDCHSDQEFEEALIHHFDAGKPSDYLQTRWSIYQIIKKRNSIIRCYDTEEAAAKENFEMALALVNEHEITICPGRPPRLLR